MLKLLATSGLLLAFSGSASEQYCYEPYGSPVIATHHVSNLMISVNWIDDDVGDSEAWSKCEINEKHNTGWCEIWVKRPQKVIGDPAMDALGHEVLHGLLGDFHD